MSLHIHIFYFNMKRLLYNVGIVLGSIALGIAMIEGKSSFKFTNIRCKDNDVNFSSFKKCELKVVRRGIVALNAHLALYQIPVTKATINIGLYKRASGYRPFLYNITQEVCAFFANRQKYPIMNVIFDIFIRESNLNHTCPYDHDIYIKNLVLEESKFKLFPIPEGEYLFKLQILIREQLKGTIEVFLYRKD
ncbi:uncharacterized protein LOC109612374 [Musca domestica]|uniref:Uncharacterized protein LOC109612374 n=1 Tax=Musca domestica TaxID=7370 RepID=A0A9J7DH60_MUSDO|nr:uncharacterized protein LOC109612374 [Musca domestica]